MKSRLFLVLAASLAVLGGLSAFALWRVASELASAQAALDASSTEASVARIDEARRHVDRALADLDGGIADLARWIPVTRQNLDAIEEVAQGLVPVLDTSRAALEEATRLEAQGLVQQGRIRLDPLRRLQEPLSRQAGRFDDLRTTVGEQTSRLLLPPVWNALERLENRARGLGRGLDNVVTGLELLTSMLGDRGARNYLVVFMNNAELRGSGGLPSGIGTLRVDNGRLSLGEFEYIGALKEPHPYRRVSAPDDFDRRFGEFYADTTLWSNLTLSPDLPDVAVVADRLYQLMRQQSSDGVLFVDPRGLQALMPAGSSITAPSGGEITKENLTNFIYEDAYRSIQDPQLRRRAMLLLGHAIFELISERGVGDLTELGAAVGGGHLRFVPFEPDEAELMAATGASGNLAPPEVDGLLATVQATAAHKLDYYVDRSVRHRCEVTDDLVECRTSVELSNDTPEGLSDFVAPEKPYGLIQNFLEVYVPRDARLTSVRRDGEKAAFIPNHQDGYKSVGFDFELERGQSTTVNVAYEVELDGHRYELVARPQPLAKDATIELELDFPADWAVFGPGEVTGATLNHSGPFNRTIEIRAQRKERAGISLAWERAAAFLNEPLF